MSHDGFPDDYYTTVEEFTDALDGIEFHVDDPSKEHFFCEFCAKGVSYNSEPRVAQYWTDRVCHENTHKGIEVNTTRKLTPMATYCEDCSSRLLFMPCEGYTEVRVYITLKETDIHDSAMIKNPEVTDVSAESDGIPWRPNELVEEIMGVGIGEVAVSGPDSVTMAPENMVTVFNSFGDGIDIRKMAQADGSFDEDLIEQARRDYAEFASKMSESGYDRRSFRDHVRGDR
jgi:hypothetical protein